MQYLKYYPFTWALVLFIFVICLMPMPTKVAPPVVGFDKLVHTGLYAFLCTVILFERVRRAKKKPLIMSHCFYGAFVLPILMSGIIELLQSSLDMGRSGDWWDMAANSLGVILVWVPFILLRKRGYIQ